MEITTDQIKNIMIESFDLDLTANEISDDMPFFGGELDIDSIDMLEFFMKIDQSFDIKINKEELKEEYFASVQSMTDYLNTQKVTQ